MTTIDSAARWHIRKLLTLATFATLTGIALSGCGTNLPILGQTLDGGLTQPGQTNTAQAPQAVATKVAIAPVIGAPASVGKQLQAQLGNALSKRNIGLSTGANDAAAYTLRGYVVSAKETSGTKVSYIWDVTDPTGKRVNRITGEELAPAVNARDPWVSVTPQITQAIATKTAGSLAAWLPTQAAQRPAAVAQKAVQPAANARPVVQTGATPAAQPAAVTPNRNTAAAGTAVTAVVPSVVGAPGDGGVSLTNAIQQELQKNGIGLARGAGGANTYRVEGKVKLGAGKNGTQPIQIDWQVKDPKGKKLGTVSQKNQIPEGSLNGAWGATAKAAAAAATQGILKLLPKNTRTAASSGTF